MSDAVVLLLSDLADSTRIAEELGEAAAASLWEAHDRAARDLLRTWRGREIDKSDGFLIVFGSVPDAVGYALAYHDALARLPTPLKARVGIHSGTVIIRSNPPADVAAGAKPLEVDGLAKAVAHRVMALARGAQTLLTAEAFTALGAGSWAAASRGHWRMKGIEHPLELFEVAAREPLLGPPPDTPKTYRVAKRGDLWLPVHALPHNLPAERDDFVGRERSLRELARRFESGTRLVSVVGTGGAGKTRLARRFGWSWLGDFPGGVWFCDLSAARELDGVVFAVAQALDVPLADGDPVAQLAAAMAGRGDCLLILDNFEQVVKHAEQTAGRWLDRAPQARFLVTSREVLGLPGESVMTLAPLAQEEGVTLFKRRAAAATSGFDSTSAEDPSIPMLVRLLDGLPLAIELAAARVRLMSPNALLERMNDRFKLLASRGGRHERQATLRATLDWSWDLLTPAEKSVLAQISVFEGGFTLEAAEAVIDTSELQTPAWPADLIQSLIDKSLVRRVGEHRFDLLLSLQEYARERLTTSGSFPGSGAQAEAHSLARHWRHFAALDEGRAIADGCADADNLIAACRRATAHADAVGAAGALLGAWAVLALRGPYRAAVELADAVLRIGGIGSAERARAEFVKASALFMLGLAAEARPAAERGLEALGPGRDAKTEARLTCLRGELLTDEARHDEAAADLQRALALAGDCGDTPLHCRVLNGLAVLAIARGQLAEARVHCEAALRIARQTADERWQGGLLGNLALLDYSEGRVSDAIDRYARALALARRAGDRRWEGNARCNLGLLLNEQGRTDQARAELETALELARNIGHSRLESTVRCNLGIVLESLGAQHEAHDHYENAVRLADALGEWRSEGQFRIYLGLSHARRGDFTDARRCLDEADALLAPTGDRLSQGLLLCARSEAECMAGNREHAVAELQRAERLAVEANATRESELGQRIAALQMLLSQPRDR
jgi:predicted ATPase/class 3 adenylate cyclase/Tfp pilus assembly protein PilF